MWAHVNFWVPRTNYFGCPECTFFGCPERIFLGARNAFVFVARNAFFLDARNAMFLIARKALFLNLDWGSEPRQRSLIWMGSACWQILSREATKHMWARQTSSKCEGEKKGEKNFHVLPQNPFNIFPTTRPPPKLFLMRFGTKCEALLSGLRGSNFEIMV